MEWRGAEQSRAERSGGEWSGLEWSSVLYGMVWYGMVWYGMVSRVWYQRYGMVLYCSIFTGHLLITDLS